MRMIYIVTAGFDHEGPTKQWIYNDLKVAEDKYKLVCTWADDDTSWDTQFDYVLLSGPFAMGDDILEDTPYLRMREYDAAAARTIRARQAKQMAKPKPSRIDPTRPAVPNPVKKA